MKKLIKKIINAAGYELKARNGLDLDTYRRLYGKDSVENRRFYNIGAGSFRHPAWTNVDHESEWYAEHQRSGVDISWDLMSESPLALEAGVAELAYSSHTVEHVTDAAAQNMFNEVHRILKPNGTFRVTMPNIDLHYRAYRDNDRDFFYRIKHYSRPKDYQRAMYDRPLGDASIQQLFLVHFAFNASVLHVDGAKKRIEDAELDRIFSEMRYEEALDYCVSRCCLEIQKKYPGNHFNWWNEGKVIRMLRAAGFAEVFRSAYGQSRVPVLRNTDYFDSTHPKESLYVEARK